jgi:hypothetical protein
MVSRLQAGSNGSGIIVADRRSDRVGAKIAIIDEHQVDEWIKFGLIV